MPKGDLTVSALTRLGQYGGPKTDALGTNTPVLLSQVTIVNNIIRTIPSYSGLDSVGISCVSTSLFGNNTLVGEQQKPIFIAPGIDASSINNLCVNTGSYEASPAIEGCTQLGGDVVSSSLNIFMANTFIPTRFAELNDGTCIDQQSIYPEYYWMCDALGVPSTKRNRCSGAINSEYADASVSISVGTKTSFLVSSTVSIYGGVAEFSVEQTSNRFGSGCEISFYRLGVLETVYVKRRVSSKSWSVSCMDGSIPLDISNVAVSSAAHSFGSLSSALTSNAIASKMGFRTSTGSFASARLNVEIAFYACSNNASLNITTLPNTSDHYRIRMFAPAGQDSCVMPNISGPSKSQISEQGFGIATSSSGYMLNIDVPRHVSIEGFKFASTSPEPVYTNHPAIQSHADAKVDVIGCFFDGMGYCADIRSGCLAINNIAYGVKVGFRVAAGATVGHNTIPNSTVTAILGSSGNRYYAFNNILAAPSFAGSDRDVFGNICADGAGTIYDGTVVGFANLGTVVSSVAANAAPIAEGLALNQKVIFGQHHYKHSDSDDNSDVLAYDDVYWAPQYALDNRDKIISAISKDAAGRDRNPVSGYCGALEYRPIDIDRAVGANTGFVSGYVTQIPTPGFDQIYNHGYYVTDSKILTGSKLVIGGNTVYVQKKITDSICVLANADGSVYTGSYVATPISSVSFDCATIGEVPSAASLFTNILSYGQSVTFHVHGANTVGSRILFKDVACNGINRLTLSGEPGSIVTMSGAGSLVFAGVNGASIVGMTVSADTSSYAPIARFTDCAEPSLKNNHFSGSGSAVVIDNQSIRSDFENNVFSGFSSAVAMPSLENQDHEFAEFVCDGDYGQTSATTAGCEAEVRVDISTSLHTSLTPVSINALDSIRVVVTTGASASAVMSYVDATMLWTLTLTVAAGTTFDQMYLAGSGTNRFSDIGFRSFVSGAFNIYVRPLGQQIRNISGTTTFYVSTKFGRPNRYGASRLTYGSARYDSINTEGNGILSGCASIMHNTFSQCASPILVRDFAGTTNTAPVHVINNAFYGCGDITVPNTGIGDYNATQPMRTRRLYSGNATSNQQQHAMLCEGATSSQGQLFLNEVLVDGMHTVGNIPNPTLEDTAVSIMSACHASRDISLYDTSILSTPSDANRYLFTAMLLKYGRPNMYASEDRNGYVRCLTHSIPGAMSHVRMSASPADIGLEIGMSNTIDSDAIGYDITYRLLHNAPYSFAIDAIASDVQNTGSQTLEYAFNNLTAISAHIAFTRFFQNISIKVEPCQIPYTCGRPLENDLAADFDINTNDMSLLGRAKQMSDEGLVVAGWAQPDAGSVSMMYNHTVTGKSADSWFVDRHLSALNKFRPAFCGCLLITGAYPSGMGICIETDPEQLGTGPAIIYGRGSMGSVFDPGNPRDPYVHSNEIGRSRGVDDIAGVIGGGIGQIDNSLIKDNACAVYIVSDNPIDLTIRNIRIAECDDRNSSSYAWNNRMLPGLVIAAGLRSVEMYCCEVGYFYNLMNLNLSNMFMGMTNNLSSVTVVNNSITQMDCASKKYYDSGTDSGYIGYDYSVGSPEDIYSVCMFANIQTSYYGFPDPAQGRFPTAHNASVPFADSTGKGVHFNILNNDILAYNSGVGSSELKYGFVQNYVSPDPHPYMLESNNRVYHPMLDNETFFGGVAKLLSANPGDIVYSSTKATNVVNPVRFGAVGRASTQPSECAIDLVEYLTDPAININSYWMQRFVSAEQKPDVNSACKRAGYDVQNVVFGTMSTDIVGNLRYHGSGANKSYDIGAFYIESAQTTFSKNNIIKAKQAMLEPASSGTGWVNDIISGNSYFPVLAPANVENYCEGAKVIIELKSAASDFSFGNNKFSRVLARFTEALYDGTKNAFIVPIAGQIFDGAKWDHLPSNYLDMIFNGIMDGRYSVDYNYANAVLTVYYNELYGKGPTGEQSMPNLIRYSEIKAASI